MARGVKGTSGVQCTTPGCTNPPAESPTRPGTYRTRCLPCGAEAQRALRDRQRIADGLPPVPRPTGSALFTAPDLPDELPPIEAHAGMGSAGAGVRCAAVHRGAVAHRRPGRAAGAR